MEKHELVKLLDELLLPLNFKRKGNNWICHGPQLSKIVNLQKSNYGSSFYVNYSYIIRDLELNTKAHVENRLASIHRDEQKEITDLLDFEIEMPDGARLEKLKKVITEKIIAQINSINSVAELVDELKTRPHLNDIPIVVKRKFNLE